MITRWHPPTDSAASPSWPARPTDPMCRLRRPGVLVHMIGGAAASAAACRSEEATKPDASDPLRSFGPVLGNCAAGFRAPD